MSDSPYNHPAAYDAAFAEQAEEAAAFLLSVLPTGGRIVSLGCGSGMVEARLADAGREVIGLDLSRSMLAAARNRTTGATWLNARIEALPLEGLAASGIIAPLLSAAYLTTEAEQRALACWIGRNLEPAGLAVLELPVAWTPMRVQGLEERTPDGEVAFRFLDADGASPWSVRLHTELRVGDHARRAPLAVFSPGGVRGLLGREAGLLDIRFLAPWDAETVRDHPPHDCLRAVVMAVRALDSAGVGAHSPDTL